MKREKISGGESFGRLVMTTWRRIYSRIRKQIIDGVDVWLDKTIMSYQINTSVDNVLYLHTHFVLMLLVSSYVLRACGCDF